MNRVLGVGLVAAVLSQYAWIIPVDGVYVVSAAVAFVCAVVAVVWTLVRRLPGGGRLP